MATDPLAQSMQAGYEERDVNTRKLLYFLLVIGVILMLSTLGVRWLFGHFERADLPESRVARTFEYDRPLPGPPRIQADPASDISDYLNSQRDTLTTYGWVNRTQGVVRIPIDRAMQLILQRGLPTRTTGENPATAPAAKTNTPAGRKPSSNTETKP